MYQKQNSYFPFSAGALFCFILFTASEFACAQLTETLSRRAFFGARIQDISDSTKTRLKLSSGDGILLTEVISGSSAAAGKFLPDDVVVSWNNQNISGVSQFLELLKNSHGGQTVRVDYIRNGVKKNRSITLVPRPMESDSRYITSYESVYTRGNHLRVIITRPKGNGPFPAVLYIGGVGCYSIDNPQLTGSDPSLKIWIDSLTLNGMVTMRVEKTGIGDSRGIPCAESDFEMETEGYRAALKYLKKLTYVDSGRIAMLGMSMGGIIGPYIATGQNIRGIVVYGTAGRNWLEYELENTHRQKIIEGMPADSLDIYMRLEYSRLYGMFVEKKTREEIINANPEIERTLFKYPMRDEYFVQVAQLPVHKLWMNTTAKVLAIHGESDYVSSSREHQLITDIVNKYHPGNGTFVSIADCDHWQFNNKTFRESKQRISQTVNLEPIKITTTWLSALFSH
jgi:uncharacterized protein